jgi:AraC-like DNA-binding protein
MGGQRRPFLFPNGARLGEDNVVLHARARRHRVAEFAGPLSIKTVLQGRVSWIVGGRKLVVDSSSFLVLNAGEIYSMHIDEPEPVETICAFFAPGFVERIALDMTAPLESALEQPGRAPLEAPFLSALHDDRGMGLVKRVQCLAAQCESALAPSGFEQEFLDAGAALVRCYSSIREQAERLQAARPATRREVYRRLLIGRDYLHAQVGAVSLHDAARAACLSPYHFHRNFTRAFGQTPHQYLTLLRLERSRRVLESGARVIDACLDAGFSSVSGYSRLFQSRYGEPPSAYRRKFARSCMKHGEASQTMGA